MFKKTVIALGVMAATGLMTGCATTTQMPAVSNPSEVANTARLHSALETTAANIAASLSTLSNINAAAHPKFQLTPAPKSGPLAMTMSLNWDGTVSPALREIASVIGYRYIEASPAPSQPLLVDVNQSDESAFNILQNIGAQLGTQANVVVNSTNKTIRLEYTTNEAGS